MKTKKEKKIDYTKAVAIKTTPYLPYAPHVRQQAFLWLDCLEALFGGAAGGGKALRISERVPTPSGWSTMGDLQPGDVVYGADGRPTEVLACSEIMLGRPCFELTFDSGDSIIVDAEHRWKTMTAIERQQAERATPEFRARRRAARASRATYKQGTHKSEVIAQRNSALAQANADALSSPCDGTVRETYEIAASLLGAGGRTNHSIGACKPLKAAKSALPIPPYVLGAWLGDGSSHSGVISCDDIEIPNRIRAHGYQITQHKNVISYGIRGLGGQLKALGLIKNKHIPSIYLRASGEQRLELLRGLMDTDGNCLDSGRCEFSSSYPALAEGFAELLASLGIPCLGRLREAWFDGERKKDSRRFKFTAPWPVFWLERKRARQKLEGFRATSGNHYIVDCSPVPSVPVRCIQVAAEDGLFLVGTTMIPTHNSDALLMSALQYVDVPGYAAILFRKTMTDLELPGSLIPRSHEWLGHTDAVWNGSTHTWMFPSKATLTFGYMRNDDERTRYRSTEFQYVGWDEVTDFTRLQYTYMFSRLRRLKTAEVPMRMRAATNPGGRGHEWCKRRFITKVDDPPKIPTERVFIKSLLKDNPSIDQDMYKYSLEQLDVQTRAHLEEGDWDAREPGNWMIRDHTWIDAAVELGREWAQQGPPEPAGELSLGVDWGTHTAGYIVWPLTNGGVYVPPSEVVSQPDEDAIDVSMRIIKTVMRFPYRLADARYDAAGAREMSVFMRTIRAETPFKMVKPVPIAFGKWKRMGILYLNILFHRVAAGATNKIIVIDPANEELIRQLKVWERKNAESEDAKKEDDHGPDALVAGVVPIAERHSDMVMELREAAKKTYTTPEAKAA